ncbi:MFS transporter [Sphaerisporangium sp. TRM90804]|uniref:MFS transporter n=1 Tax=Sphaerisporangium sp. TRM90804 TaxID=3031113 RepID=UPI00244B422A|nr:MFS transporter [Sphaerisporangium sp. TRM90804]MDH2425280.1 MFS transporter [Sphaerisporangium sp. TRM90804]
MIPLRALRAAVFAVVSVMLGVCAHTLAGGSVSGLAVLAAWGTSFLPAWLLAGRERSAAVIAPSLALAQAALHLLFSLAHAVEPVVAHDPGHVHSGLVPGLGMLLTHAWAVGMTALWLSRGEAALWSLLRRLAVRLFIAFAVHLDPARAAIVVPPAERRVIPRLPLLVHEMRRRGPPGGVRTVSA